MPEDARPSPLGPLTGVAHVVLVFAGSAVVAGSSGAGRHSLDADAAEIADYVAGADATRVWIGEWIAVLGYLAFPVFAAAVARTLTGATRSAAGFATGYVTLALAGTACLAPVLNRNDAAVAAGFLDLRTTLFMLAFLAYGAWSLQTGLQALRSGGLPRWLAWTALVIGALHVTLAPLATVDVGFTGIPTFAGFLWIAVTSVVLARRRT